MRNDKVICWETISFSEQLMVSNIHFAQLFFKLHLCKQTLYSVSFKINSTLKNTICPEMNVI